LTLATLVEAPSGFHALSLSRPVLAALARVGYRDPTPIQAAVIPEALPGRDVIGQAQTGTGKTAAFLLPFLNSWRDNNEPGPQALVLAPTTAPASRPEAGRGTDWLGPLMIVTPTLSASHQRTEHYPQLL